ncbi:MAG TPA: hypothetical protein VHB21_24670, partial [Minicystis sp.]|nr:hypothetical protein [Minicystis sp.]
WVRVTNPHDHAVTVEYRIGPFADCRKNNDFVGSRVVPAHDVWTLEVRSEGNACIRLAGSARWWHNKVTHGQTHQYTVE